MKNKWNIQHLIDKGFCADEHGNFSKVRSGEPQKKEKVSKPNADFSSMIFIPGHVPSSKNSRRNFQPKGKDGKPIYKENGKMKTVSLKSEAVVKYQSQSQIYWEENFALFMKKISGLARPLHIRFHFVRKTAQRYDWINPTQTIQDIMVKFGYIEDDDTTNLKPFFGHTWVDKDNPGVYIEVLNNVKE